MSIVFFMLLCYYVCCGEYLWFVLNGCCVWWTDFCWTDDGCMYRFRNFTIYMVLFYGLDFEILQYIWFFAGCSLSWNAAFFYILSYIIHGIILWFRFRNLKVYKIQLKILQYTRFNWKFYCIQDSILQYTRFNQVRTLITNSNWQ